MEHTELILIEAEMRWFFFHLCFLSFCFCIQFLLCFIISSWLCLLFIYAVDLFIHNETYIGYMHFRWYRRRANFIHSFIQKNPNENQNGCYFCCCWFGNHDTTVAEFYEFAESKEIMLTMDVKQMALRLANDAKWQHTRT